MKTVTYPIRFKQDEYDRLMAEAQRRRKPLSDLLRDLITYGLPALPALPDPGDVAVAEYWEPLGPAPEVIYDKLPKEW